MKMMFVGMIVILCFSTGGYTQDSSCCIVPYVKETGFIVPYEKRYEYIIDLFLKNNCKKNISVPIPDLGYEKYGAEMYFKFFTVKNKKRLEIYEEHGDINQVWYDTLHFKGNEKKLLENFGLLSLCRIDKKGDYFFIVFYRGENCLSQTKKIRFRIE